MRNKALWVIIPTMLVLMFLDYGTAALNGPLLKDLETNPIFMAGGSLLLLLVLNTLFILIYYWSYTRLKPFWRYLLISTFVWHSIIRIYAIRSNILAWLHPPTPEQIAQITTAMKQAQYTTLVLSIFIPILVTIIVYALFRIDHHVQTKNLELD